MKDDKFDELTTDIVNLGQSRKLPILVVIENSSVEDPSNMRCKFWGNPDQLAAMVSASLVLFATVLAKELEISAEAATELALEAVSDHMKVGRVKPQEE